MWKNNEHICEENDTDTKILRSGGVLFIMKVKNVIEGDANIYIEYCPFCGEKLFTNTNPPTIK